jgi:hypothetical protein
MALTFENGALCSPAAPRPERLAYKAGVHVCPRLSLSLSLSLSLCAVHGGGAAAELESVLLLECFLILQRWTVHARLRLLR